MVKAHNKSRPELSAMKVTELKALVRTHNLDNAIRRYSSMKKSELVDALVKHSSGEKAAAKKPAPKPAPKPAAKPAPKPAAKKPAAKKPKLEIVEKKETPAERAARRAKPRVIKSIPIGKNPELAEFSSAYAKDKAALRALRLNDPVAYEAKLTAIDAAQKANPSQSELFDMKKKAARQKKPAAKKPAAKKAAPKKKPAAKKEFVYMIPGLAELGRSKGQPEKYIEEQRKAEAFAKDFLKRRAAFLAGTGPAPPFGEEAKFNRGKDATREHARSIKFLLVTKPAMEAFAKTPEGLAKAALDRKKVARDSTLRREGVERRAKEREAARAAKKGAAKALPDADPKKVAAAAKRRATMFAKQKAELKRKEPYLTDADAEAIVKIRGSRKESSLLNPEFRKIVEIRRAAMIKAGLI